jgi:hypothetical protein
MLMVHGDSQEVARARDVLKSSGLSSFVQHSVQSEAATAALA